MFRTDKIKLTKIVIDHIQDFAPNSPVAAMILKICMKHGKNIYKNEQNIQNRNIIIFRTESRTVAAVILLWAIVLLSSSPVFLAHGLINVKVQHDHDQCQGDHDYDNDQCQGCVDCDDSCQEDGCREVAMRSKMALVLLL